MSHKRKDTFAKTRVMWKHLKPMQKRIQARRERIEARKNIAKDLEGME